MTDEEKNDEKEKKKIKLIEVEAMRDLISLSAGPMGSVNRVHHLKIAGKHLYVLIGGVPGSVVLYYIILDEITERYIVYNNLLDKISYSDTKESNPQTMHIPIIHIKRQNLVKEEDFEGFL